MRLPTGISDVKELVRSSYEKGGIGRQFPVSDIGLAEMSMVE